MKFKLTITFDNANDEKQPGTYIQNCPNTFKMIRILTESPFLYTPKNLIFFSEYNEHHANQALFTSESKTSGYMQANALRTRYSKTFEFFLYLLISLTL